MASGITNQNTLALAVEGYADRQSYVAGDEVVLHCSCRTATFSVEVARVGATRDVVLTLAGVAGGEQPVPPEAYATGCGWSESVRFAVPEEWRSGYYEVALRADGVDGPGAESQAFFVVRATWPGRDARIVLVLATNTWNAYNLWGGRCLYTGATQVSFRRPMDRGFLRRAADTDGYDGRVASIDAQGDPGHHRLLAYLERHRLPMWCASSGWHTFERRFVRWAEANGYAFDVVVNADLEVPGALDGYRLLLSVGHDEYWTWAMRDTIDAFVASGGNHAIFSGNTSFWQVRLEDDGATMVAYKGAAGARDPVVGTSRDHLRTSFWSDPAIGRPETSTIGLTFTRGGYARVGWGTPRSSGGYTVQRPEHWAFAGTDLRYGDQLGAPSVVVGYETDGCALTMHDGLLRPTHEDGAPDSLEVLATAPARLLSNTATVSEIPKALWADVDGPGDLEGVAAGLFGSASPEHVARIAHGHCVMAAFTRGAGTVFNAGSTDWVYGLEHDADVQRVTRNVLDRLST
jgi:hypothetical protein